MAIPHISAGWDNFTGLAGQAANTTRYIRPGNGGAAGSEGLEATVRRQMRSAGTASGLAIRVVTNDRAASTLTFRVNGANGNQTVSITGSTTGVFQDTTNTDAIDGDDQIAIALTTGAGGSTFTWTGVGFLFAADTDSISRHMLEVNTNVSDGRGLPISGGLVATAEAAAQTRYATGGTIRDAVTAISPNTRDGTSTLALRINGADSAVALSIPAGTSGTFEDTGTTDTFVADDTLNWKMVHSGTTGSIAVTWAAVSIQTADGAAMVVGSTSTFSPGTGTTRYAPIAGNNRSSWAATESNVQFPALAAGTLSDLFCTISANTVNGASTLTLRNGAADTTLQASITASTTGTFADATNTEAVTTGDLLDVHIVVGGTSGGLTIDTYGLLWDGGEGGAGSPTGGATRLVGRGRLVGGRLVGGILVRTLG